MTADHPPPYACVTVDLDTLGCYRDIHGLDPIDATHRGDPAYRIGVRRLLDLCRAAGIRATLFVIGRDVAHPAHAALLAEAGEAGFELGNHTFSHFYDLPERDAATRSAEFARAEEAIAEVWGCAPVGFRAPGYHLDDTIVALCAERGYLYDSSVFACPPYYLAKGAIMAWQALRGRPSRSAMVPAQTLLAPLHSYRPSRQGFWRADATSDLPVEVPMCVVPGVRFPVIGTSLHLMGRSGFDLALPLLERTYPKILQLEFHAIDFMDAEDVADPALVDVQPDLRVPWADKRALYSHVFGRLRETYAFGTLETAVRAHF